jgi:hypothetical protein
MLLYNLSKSKYIHNKMLILLFPFHTGGNSVVLEINFVQALVLIISLNITAPY